MGAPVFCLAVHRSPCLEQGGCGFGGTSTGSEAVQRREPGLEGGRRGRGGGNGGRTHFVACVSHLTVDHATLSRRSTVPAPNRDTSNIGVLGTFFPHTNIYIYKMMYLVYFLEDRDWQGVFFRLGLSMGFSTSNFSFKSLRSSAVFEERLQRPSPCLIRSAPGRERVWRLRKAIENWLKKCILGGARGLFYGS